MTQLNELHPLVDGDVLVYACGFSADSSYRKHLAERGVTDRALQDRYMEEDDYTGYAIVAVRNAINAIADKFSDKLAVYLTGSGNFREALATIQPYKGNRDPTHKPKYYKEIKEYMIRTYGAEVIEGMEADDAMAMEQYADKTDSTVICTIDKDLDQVPGHHYNPRKDALYYVTEEEGNCFFWRQMLLGDSSDNIPGIKGIGEVKSAKLLAGLSADECRVVVQKEYQRQYGDNWKAAYEEVGELLWMIREEGVGPPMYAN